MWRCAKCNEAVEDNFDTCWNCGASADGTVDSSFTPEPDDPAVPDPGEEAEVVAEQSVADSPPAATSAAGMNRREIAELICKTIALILFAVAAVLSVSLLMLMISAALSGRSDLSFNSYAIFTFFVVAVPVLTVLGVGIFYWMKSASIASFMVSADPAPVMLQRFTVHDAMVVTFSTTGLIFVIDGVRDLAWVLYVTVSYERTYPTPVSEFFHTPEAWVALVQLVVATWLLLGSRGIIAAVNSWRTAGAAGVNDVSDDEGEAPDT